jgi:hypothetical protein
MFTSSRHVTVLNSLRTAGAFVAAVAGAHVMAGCSGPPGATSGQTASFEGLSSSVETDSLRSRPGLPPLPSPTLAVPAGNTLAFAYHGVGVQIYACEAAATGYAWVFVAPEATLYDCRGQAVATHFAGPTWEDSSDESTVVGAKLAGFTVDPTAIPWLLLQAASHTGDGRMSDVTYVQRLSTVGGNAPTTGCDAEHVGAASRVDYTATYAFYEGQGDY